MFVNLLETKLINYRIKMYDHDQDHHKQSIDGRRPGSRSRDLFQQNNLNNNISNLLRQI